MVKGIDISNVNGAFDLAPYRKDGYLVVGLKATEGMTFNDATFDAHVAQATKLGMVSLPYHFGRPESDKGAPGGVREAHHFLEVVAPHKGNSWVGKAVLDYETVPDVAFASAWLHTVANRGWQPMVYCSASRVAELRSRVPRGTKYWIADYGVSQLPDLGVPVWIWQYTDKEGGHSLDGDHVLVDPQLLHRVPPAWYLVVRAKGKVIARVRYGKGRVAAFLKNRFRRIVSRCKVTVDKEH
jgi:GH25 family lysozyme M1 (1,4-beta-N-acetylmuramidase)